MSFVRKKNAFAWKKNHLCLAIKRSYLTLSNLASSNFVLWCLPHLTAFSVEETAFPFEEIPPNGLSKRPSQKSHLTVGFLGRGPLGRSLRKPWYIYRGFRLSKSVDFRPFNGNNGFKKIVVKVTKTNAAIILNVEIESTGIKVRANARSKFGFFDGQTKRINRSIFS